MPTILNSGTANLVISTPQTIYTSASNKNYTGKINMRNMQSGDTTLLQINVKVLSGDTFSEGEVFRQEFSGANGGQASPVFFIPYTPAEYGIEIILTQTAGTGRAYKWIVTEP